MRCHHALAALLTSIVAACVSHKRVRARAGKRAGSCVSACRRRPGLDYVDPALSFTQPGWALLDATCARLMTYPDKPAPAAYRLEREVAAGYRISRNFRTYTFTLRPGFRFSNGKPVRASAFANAMNRALQPFVNAAGAIHMQDIVGAFDVLQGRRRTASGIVARGNTLVVQFTRPAPDFLARTAMPYFCAVPPNLPSSGEGVGAFPSAGPYYVDEYRPGERVVIKRNPYYGGTRKVHLDGFDVDLRAGSPQDQVQRIDRGEADWGHSIAAVFMDQSLGLVAKYDINRTRFFVKPGLTLRMLAFNSSDRSSGTTRSCARRSTSPSIAERSSRPVAARSGAARPTSTSPTGSRGSATPMSIRSTAPISHGPGPRGGEPSQRESGPLHDERRRRRSPRRSS